MKRIMRVTFVMIFVCVLPFACAHAQGLTPAERQKIIEEERLRQQIRGQDECIRKCQRWVGTSYSQRENQRILELCRQQCGQ
jgi:hypothetical protein